MGKSAMMTRLRMLAIGVTLGAAAVAQAQQQDITSRPRTPSYGATGLGTTSPTGADSTVPGGSAYSPIPGGTIPMGAATQGGSQRPSLGPNLGPDLKDSLTPPRD